MRSCGGRKGDFVCISKWGENCLRNSFKTTCNYETNDTKKMKLAFKVQNEICRKVESMNNREDKHWLPMRKSPGPQYTCHLNILGYPNGRTSEKVLEMSLKEILMITNVSGLLRVVRNAGVMLPFLSHLRIWNSYSSLYVFSWKWQGLISGLNEKCAGEKKRTVQKNGLMRH